MMISKRFKKGYSLLEVLVTLGVIGIVITMLFNVLIISLQVTVKILGRNFVREEVANAVGLMSRDLRNADFVIECGTSDPSACEYIFKGQRYAWLLCGTAICKESVAPTGERIQVYSSSGNLSVTTLLFDVGYVDYTNDAELNTLITVVGDHTNEALNIRNIIKQVSVSTRNYEI